MTDTVCDACKKVKYRRPWQAVGNPDWQAVEKATVESLLLQFVASKDGLYHPQKLTVHT